MSTVKDNQSESKIANPVGTGLSSARQSGNARSNENVVCLLKAAGGAPILKRQRWEFPRSKTFGHIAEFLKKHMQLDIQQQKQLFLYVNQAFAPALDTTIGAVNDCFYTEGALVIHYSLTEAWG
jgi:ubiquitin-like protein ATG12